MLPFLRSDLSQLKAYTPHPGHAQESGAELAAVHLDPLDTNESPFDLPEELKQKLAWIYQQTIATNRYPDGGHLALKHAIAQYVNQTAGENVEVTSAHLSVGNGSDELIRSLLIATCLGGVGSILVAEPTFSMYAILAKTLGIPVIRIGRSPINFEMDLEAAQEVISTPQVPPLRAIFVVHPNSPTANPLTAAEVNWLRSLPEHLLVVIDEAYFEFSQTTLAAELLRHPNWVILRTFSKAFRLAALRVGYAIAHPELTEALEKVRLPYNLPAFSLAAAQLALTHQHTLLETIPLILSERDRLLQILSQVPGLQVWTSAANFIFVRLHLTDSSIEPETALQQIHHQLKARGTLVRLISGGLRITIGSPTENDRTVDRITSILQSPVL